MVKHKGKCLHTNELQRVLTSKIISSTTDNDKYNLPSLLSLFIFYRAKWWRKPLKTMAEKDPHILSLLIYEVDLH